MNSKGSTSGVPADQERPAFFDESRRRVQQVEIPLSSLIALGLIVVGTVLLLRAIDRTQQLIALALLAALLSAVVAPAVRALQRLVGRTAAAVLLNLVVFFVLLGATGALLQQIGSEADALSEFAGDQIEEVDGESSELLQRSGFDERLGEAAANWGTVAVIGENDATGIATRASELTIVIVLSIFFTLQGGSIVDMVAGWTSDRERRRHLREMWGSGVAAGAEYLRRSALVAFGSGVSAAGLAAAFGLPAVALVGVWAALLSAVPLLGAVVGWAPVVVLAVIETSTRTSVVVAALALAGVIAVNLLRAHLVVAPVKPGSFLIAMGIACGLTAGGIPGAIAAMFAVVGIVTVMGQSDVERNIARLDDASESPRTDSTPTAPVRPVTPPALEELADPAVLEHSSGTAGTAALSLTLSRRTALQITAFVVLAFVVQLAITRVGPILVWAVVGALIAIGLDRPVSWVERRLHLPRAVVVIVLALCAAGVVAGLLVTASGSFGDARPMDEGIPDLVESLTELPVVGDDIANADLEERIDRFQQDVPRLLTRSPVAGQAFGLLGGGVIGAFWVTLTALSCLLDGPRLVRAIDRRVPARITRQVTRLARAGKVALGGYVAGAAVVAAMNGGLVLLLGLAFSVPLAAVIALWAFSWNFIPQVGAIIGWAPLIILAVLESPLRGTACLLIFLVYQVIENNAIQPTIVGNAVDIGALAALGAALAGAAIAGLIGAALAIPVAGVARALYRESHRDDFPSVRSRTDAVDGVRSLP